MAQNKEQKREALRAKLTIAAESEIEALGIEGLKARNITAKAGCALGALYNAVDDLNELIMLVNSRTLARLAQKLRHCIPDGAKPDEAMHALSQAYVDFVLTEPRLWFAAFHHRLPEGQEFPQWHQNEYIVLIDFIAGPLAKIRPDLAPAPLALRAQTLFAAVHGVVQLCLNGQFVGSPRDELANEVKGLIDAMTRGMNNLSAAND